MRDARQWETRLWDGFCEKHAYERHADEMVPVRSTSMRDAPTRDTPERHVYGMVYGRCTPIKCPSIGNIYLRNTSN
jgi:hypothetical protein